MKPDLARAARPALRTALIALCTTTAALAVTTQTWTRDGDTLRTGTIEGMVITPDGELSPGPRADVLARPETGVLWSVLALKGEVFAAGGEKTGVMDVTGGKLETIAASNPAATAPVATPGKDAAATPAPRAPARIAGQEVFVLAEGSNGALYAATGPSGAIYRIDAKKREAIEIYRPQATYVWAMLAEPGGSLLLGTGLPGRVVRVDAKGNATTLWESQDQHVRSLALAPGGKILAGTSGSGLLVELDGKGGAFTLWDSDRPETVAIAVDSHGTIWAAFAGPATKSSETSPTPARPAARGGSTNITVRPRGNSSEDEPTAKGSAEEAAAAASAPRSSELPGGGGSLVRIGAGDEPETSWNDDKETPLCLLARPDGGVLAGTANPAHIWWFDAAGRLGLFDERKENRAVSALSGSGDRVFAALSNPAAIVSYGPEPSSPARWTSEVADARVRSTIGRVRALVDRTNAAVFTVLVRSGNTSEPGPGWTDWVVATGAAGPPDGGGGAVTLPRSRFFQVRVEAKPERAFTPGVNAVVLRYRPTNRAPRLENIDTLPQGVALRSMPPPQVSSGEIPVIPPPRGPELERALGESSGTWRSKRAYEPSALTLTWEGRDPDNDELHYRLEYCPDRGGPCTANDWITLADDLEQAFFSFDSRTLPDGVYRFRVTADDSHGNAVGEGRQTSRISDPVAIDNAPPDIEAAQYTAGEAGKINLRVTAHDDGGRIVRAEVATQPGEFYVLRPVDGVDDGRAESWTATVDAPKPGESVLVRVTDASGNSTTKRAEPR